MMVRIIKRFFLTNLLLLMLSSSVFAAQGAEINDFIREMANRHAFNQSSLADLFQQVKIRNSIVKLIDRPKSSSNKRVLAAWDPYRSQFLTTDRIEAGVNFWRQNARTLQRAESVYGIPPEIIMGIIGVETIYGKNTGGYRVIDALTTLAFNSKQRADFFRKELEEFLLLTREENADPLALTGSYAGAMGLPQFMPSSFRNYAIDFDGDGKRNIWTNPTDTIGSVANYLKHRDNYGWQAGQPVIMAAQVRDQTAADTLLALEYEPKYSLQSLKKQGLLFYGDVPENTLGILIDLKTDLGVAYWVGFPNFYVITRYNRSNRYAMAVYQLAQEIAAVYHENY